MIDRSIFQKYLHIRYATISTADELGEPWAAPVWYVVDDKGKIYWWSPKTSQHSTNIYLSNKVYITIFDSSVPEGQGKGLYIKATAGEVEEKDIRTTCDIYNQTTEIFTLSYEDCSGDAPTRLYYAEPVVIWENSSTTNNGYQDIRQEIINVKNA